VAGTAIGLVIAWASLKLMTALFVVAATTSSSNPVLIFGAPSLLAVLALIACFVPARRSTRIDPAVTLRQE